MPIYRAKMGILGLILGNYLRNNPFSLELEHFAQKQGNLLKMLEIRFIASEMLCISKEYCFAKAKQLL